MNELRTLAPDECWERLRENVAGRIGFDLGTGPRIHPVNYAVDDGTIVLRTSRRSELSRFVDLFAGGAIVAFEVDVVDYDWHVGWSILVDGRISRVEDPDELARLEGAWTPRPWAGGERDDLLRITPVEVTGRQIGASITSEVRRRV